MRFCELKLCSLSNVLFERKYSTDKLLLNTNTELVYLKCYTYTNARFLVTASVLRSSKTCILPDNYYIKLRKFNVDVELNEILKILK